MQESIPTVQRDTPTASQHEILNQSIHIDPMATTFTSIARTSPSLKCRSSSAYKRPTSTPTLPYDHETNNSSSIAGTIQSSNLYHPLGLSPNVSRRGLISDRPPSRSNLLSGDSSGLSSGVVVDLVLHGDPARWVEGEGL